MRSNLFALAAGLAATASAFDCSGPYFSFYNRNGNAMSYDLLDPAIFPGVQSPHLHSFDGGNGLAADMSFDTTQDSSCTTARIKPDKSLYWRPTLFWNGNNTGFYRVPDKFLKIYYKFGDAGNVRANVTEFPENFRMIAGYPMRRSKGDNPGGMKWACLQENYARIDSPDGSFPKGFTSCKEGLTSEITFPACWNGKELDPKDPYAHMEYPTNGGTGLEACPETHRTARFPSIFIEFWYDVSAFDGQYDANSVPWVLANGDPTGYGFHADFLNGWEKGVLAKATAETGYCNCGCGCGEEQMKQCFGADNVNEGGDWTCSAEPVFAGDTSKSLEKLPGCNPIQSGPADATQATGEGCAATAAPSADGDASKTSGTVSSGTPAPESSYVASTSASKNAEVEDVATSALPSLTMSMGTKQPVDGEYGAGNNDDYELASPSAVPTSEGYAPIVTTTAVSDGGSLGLIFSDEATNPPSSKLATRTDEVPSVATTASPIQPSGPAGGGECKAPVYITITPTVYVTADAAGNMTCVPTVTQTVTNTATITVPAGGVYRHKRHANLHHKI